MTGQGLMWFVLGWLGVAVVVALAFGGMAWFGGKVENNLVHEQLNKMRWQRFWLCVVVFMTTSLIRQLSIPILGARREKSS